MHWLPSTTRTNVDGDYLEDDERTEMTQSVFECFWGFTRWTLEIHWNSGFPTPFLIESIHPAHPAPSFESSEIVFSLPIGLQSKLTESDPRRRSNWLICRAAVRQMSPVWQNRILATDHESKKVGTCTTDLGSWHLLSYHLSSLLPSLPRDLLPCFFASLCFWGGSWPSTGLQSSSRMKRERSSFWSAALATSFSHSARCFLAFIWEFCDAIFQGKKN